MRLSLTCALFALALVLSANAQSGTSTGQGSQSILGLLGIDGSALDGSRLEQVSQDASQWLEDVRESAAQSLQRFPLVGEILSTAEEGSTANTLVEALGLEDSVNGPILGGLQGDGIFTQDFLGGLGDAGTLFSGQPLQGSTVQQIRDAVEAAGGNRTVVGSFLERLFSTAAGPQESQTLFQSVTDRLRQSPSFGSFFDQAVEQVRSANGGVLPALDGAFVDQVTQLFRNTFGTGQGGLLGGSNGFFGDNSGK